MSRRQPGSRLSYEPDPDVGLPELINRRMTELGINQSEVGRRGGTGDDGEDRLTRSTVHRLLSRGLSPPLEEDTITGLYKGLQVSRREVQRSVVISLGLGGALSEPSPQVNELILRVADLSEDRRRLWYVTAEALATAMLQEPSGS